MNNLTQSDIINENIFLKDQNLSLINEINFLLLL